MPSLAPETKARRSTVRAIVAAEVALSALLGMYTIGSKSLWADEGFSAMASSYGLRSIFGDTVDGRNMTGYHVVLSLWRNLGTSEAVLRSLSVVATAASVVVLFALVRRLSGVPAGLIAGFLIAIAPFAVRYSQELRAYAMLLLAVSAASLAFVEAVERRGPRWWGLYVLVAAASCYVHLYAGIVIAAHAASLLTLRLDRRAFQHTAASFGAVLVLVTPALALFASTGAERGEASGVRGIGSVVANVAGGKALAFLVLILVAPTLWRGWTRWRRHGRSVETWRTAFVPVWIVVGLAFVLMNALTSSARDRYFIVLLPAFVGAAATTLASLRDRRLGALALVVFTVLAAFKLINWYDAPAHEDWRAATSFVLAHSSGEDGVIFCIPAVRKPFEYYALRSDGAALPTPLSPSAPWGDDIHADPAPAGASEAWRLAPPRIWVVSRYASTTDPGVCNLATSMQGRDRTVARYIGGITVERYDLPES